VRRGGPSFVSALALATLAAAGCAVDVEGAPCATAGEATDCPDGQACGNDLRCSVRALGCRTFRCAPGSIECKDAATARRCDRAADPVCGRWVDDTCAAAAPDCQVVADPEILATGRTPPPAIGIPQPPECRFGDLRAALAAAAAQAPRAATVRVENVSATGPYARVTAQAAPLVVPANVSVVPASGNPTPVVRGEPGASPIVRVEGALEGVRVEGGGATGIGIAMTCGASGAPSLRHVTVDGEGVLDPSGLVTAGLTSGVTVAGACGARLVGVDVEAVSSVALTLGADPLNAGTIEVLGGSYTASSFGIHVRAGQVTVAPDPDTAASTIVSSNAVDGIVIGRNFSGLQASGVLVDVGLDAAVVRDNGGTGIVMAALHSDSKVRVTRCDIVANGSARAVRYGSPVRTAGGVLVALSPIADFGFLGNRLWLNNSDQLAFDSLTTWSIAAGTCGSDTNVFACMLPTCISNGPCAVAAPTATVHAGQNVWPDTPPISYVSPNVDGVAAGYCLASDTAVPPVPTCP
jgi:hypothetical protein